MNNLRSYLSHCLHTLYAQLRGITLAPPVLPRRLARVFAGASFLAFSIFYAILIRKIPPYILIEYFNIAGSSVSSLPKIPHCSRKSAEGHCLSPIVAEQPLGPAKHIWLGVLLLITPTT